MKDEKPKDRIGGLGLCQTPDVQSHSCRIQRRDRIWICLSPQPCSDSCRAPAKTSITTLGSSVLPEGCWRVTTPRHEFINPVEGITGDVCQQMAQPGFGVDTFRLAVPIQQQAFSCRQNVIGQSCVQLETLNQYSFPEPGYLNRTNSPARTSLLRNDEYSLACESLPVPTPTLPAEFEHSYACCIIARCSC